MNHGNASPNTAPPLLALAMIVRDGGQFLDSLLGSARPHVDEIVVVDTGSRDGSREAALAHGSRLLEFPWCDDFAAARNASLAATRARWILCLDADEQLAPADWHDLRATAAAWQENGPAAGRIVTRNYLAEPWSRRGWEPVPADDPHALPDRPGPVAPGFVATTKIRLFPNHDRVRFRGRLHETVEASVRELGLPTTNLPVVVHHFGLLAPDAAKVARYLDLAHRKTAEQPADAGAWNELADCALAAGNQALALQAAERALTLAPDHVDARLTAGWLHKEAGAFARAEAHLLAVAGCATAGDGQFGQACHLRAQVAMLDGRSEAAGPLLMAALRLLPDDGHVHNTLGAWHLTCGRGEPARAALERAAAMLPHVPDPCLNLARMYEAAGHPVLAARHYEAALQRDPGRASAREALERLAQPA
ncbi:MAG: glycosyltransferase [bacterium]|nr:glycosyltransferase [bacterium]